MIGPGCFLTLCLMAVLVGGGSLGAERHGRSPWAGLGWGLLAWVTAMAGYAAWLTILDRWRSARYPNRQPDPWWLVPLVWVAFAGMVPVTITVGRMVFGR